MDHSMIGGITMAGNVVTTSAEPVSKPTGAGTPADALGVTKRMSTSDAEGQESCECPTCGEEYASELGVKIHHKKIHGESIRETVCCEWCGENIPVKPSHRERTTYCSRECKDTALRDGDPPDAETLEQLHWDEELSVVAMSEQLGLSRSCIQKWMDKHGVERRSYTEAQRLNFEQMDEETLARIVGPAHEAMREAVENGEWHLQTPWDGHYEYGAGWTGEKRETVRERDGRKCQACGMSEDEHLKRYECRLDVHHIVPAARIDDAEKRNAKDNLVTMCRSCHREWEGVPLRPHLSE